MKKIMRNSPQRKIFVKSLSPTRTRGWIFFYGLTFPCALGRSGQKVLKREGDGATPMGSFCFEWALYRQDQISMPRTKLPIKPIKLRDGWCDASGDRNYNRQIQHPYPSSAEKLWRKDHLYDVVVVLSYNRRPRVQGCGSAIFMHLAHPDYPPTEGCIALKRSHLLFLLQKIDRRSRIKIG